MAPFIVLSMAWLLAGVSGVAGGSRAWESSLGHALEKNHRNPHLLVTRDDVLPVISSNGSHVLARHQQQRRAHHGGGVGKRWFGVEHTDAHKHWKQGNIIICFEDKEHDNRAKDSDPPLMMSTEQILIFDLIEARRLWQKAGLDETDPKGDDPGWWNVDFKRPTDAWCKNEANRGDFLMVIFSGRNVEKMATSVGKVMLNDKKPFLTKGPTMVLSNLLDMGHQSVVANYAHEMGHAWGLHHEHQNPRWWKALQATDNDGEKVYFEPGTSFHCENLKDHGDAVTRVREKYAGRPSYEIEKAVLDLCRDRNFAANEGFNGGLNYLPVYDSYLAFDNERTEPDWESLMIYPSIAGSTGTGANRPPILRKGPGGAIITPVTKPSRQDVAGLKKLYNSPKVSAGQLIAEVGNKVYNTVKNIRKKDPDVACV